MRRMLAAAAIVALGLPAMAAAQAQAVCTSQEALEQYLDSGGDYLPATCRLFEATPVDQRACVMQLAGAGNDGLLDALADAAMPSELWVACDALAGAG